jgi:hypothetical protein
VTVEAEYVATTIVACQVVWLCRPLGDLQQEKERPTPMYYDNSSIKKPCLLLKK